MKPESLRIAILSTRPVPTNGWGRYTRELITGLAHNGAKITLITDITTTDADFADLPIEKCHRVLPGLTPAPHYLSFRLLALVPIIARLIAGYDIVHVIAEPYTLAVPLTRRIVVTAHGTYLPLTSKRRGVGFLYRAAYKRAKVICVSHYTQSIVNASLSGLDSSVIPNGVSYEKYQQQGIPQAKQGSTVLSVGQLKHRKGFHILAKALKQVREKIPTAQVVFVGDTSDQKYVAMLHRQITEDGLEDAVHILGRISDEHLLGWYHAADAFALPAINTGEQFEGFGLVYLEANAAGLPAIGTLGCGAEDAIRDGESGYLIPQNNPDALADKLIQILTDVTLRKKLSTFAVQHAKAHTWDEIASKVMTVYRHLLN